MRKGVVMIMALALIMILTLAVLKSTTTTENYLSDISDTLFNIQFNRTFLDMTAIVQDATKEIDEAEMFKSILDMPLVISDDKTALEGVMTMAAASGKFNINHLINSDENSTVNQQFYDLLYSLMRDYQVSDGLLFLSMLLDAIDKDESQRSFGSELAHLENAQISDGGIPNKNAFNIILDTYATSIGDGNIYKVPWDKIITYSGNKVDYNYLDSKIKALLERDYGINTPFDDSLVEDDEDLSLDDEQKALFKELGIKYYVPALVCDFEFYYIDKQMSINFEYNLETRRISNIEAIF